MTIMAVDDANLEFMLDLDEVVKRLGIKPKQVKTPDPEASLPRAGADSEPTQPSAAAKPLMDLYAERMAKHNGAKEKEVEEAKPDRELQELWDWSFKNECERIARREADAKDEKIIGWQNGAKLATTDVIDLYKERTEKARK